MTLEIDTFAVGEFQTNTYVVRSGGECWVIDPGMSPGPVVAFLEARGLAPSRILLTHGHCDHIAGIGDVRAVAPAAMICAPAADAEMLTSAALNLSGPFGMPMTAPPADELLEAGQELSLGESLWQVLDTSGHTVGGVSFYCQGEAVVFTGDSLFAQGVGRTDIPGGDWPRLLENILARLLTLPGETRVCPGHGPETTIGTEKLYNPFIQSR
jgi:hydroxyacylglutathione hydrolase